MDIETIDELVDQEAIPVSSYCFDRAGLEKCCERYRACLAEDARVRDIAIACLVFDSELTYGQDGGPVQKEMYARLHDGSELDPADFCQDRMTNFLHVLKMVSCFLEEGRLTPLRVSRRHPAKGACFSFYEEHLRESKIVFRDELNRLARNSSTLGNYWHMPAALQAVGKGLNSAKEGFLVLSGASKSIWVNDQCALFLAWLEDEAELTDGEERMVATWKEAMLIHCCEDSYRQAAQHYEQAVLAEDAASCSFEFEQYLKCVNDAIETRSDQIARKIRRS